LNLLEFMYTANRLEWHLGDEKYRKPRRFLCGLVVRQASLLILFNRLAVALAKSQDHRASCGVFLLDQTVLHTIARPQPGGVEEKGYTVCQWLGGSSRTIRAAGRIIKPRGVWSIHSMMILRCRGEAPSLSTLLLWGRGVFG
jgi:hypothetical protein